jgi:mRNA interferase MazF
MATFKTWDVVKVPFPYTDRPIRQYRPALVIVAGSIQVSHGLLWVLMITSAAHRNWDEDVVVSNLGAAGLPAPSMVRCAKITTIEARDSERIGILPQSDRVKVAVRLARLLSEARKPGEGATRA